MGLDRRRGDLAVDPRHGHLTATFPQLRGRGTIDAGLQEFLRALGAGKRTS